MKTWTIWILVDGAWEFSETMTATSRKVVTEYVRASTSQRFGTWKVRQGDHS